MQTYISLFYCSPVNIHAWYIYSRSNAVYKCISATEQKNNKEFDYFNLDYFISFIRIERKTVNFFLTQNSEKKRSDLQVSKLQFWKKKIIVIIFYLVAETKKRYEI